jgi:uncharacterized phage protein (TIGR02216 family)
MSDAPRPFPWDEAMTFALCVLRWPPDAFWRATPRELLAALGGAAGQGAAPATAGDLARLMQAFPDSSPDMPRRPERSSPE